MECVNNSCGWYDAIDDVIDAADVSDAAQMIRLRR
jgi:hypothetical protein